MRIERKLETTAAQLQNTHVSVACEPGIGSRMHTEERNLTAACELFEVTAGVRHSIDFVKSVGKKCYTPVVIQMAAS
jgi:hypothetical protein